jgi:hypothetical protein
MDEVVLQFERERHPAADLRAVVNDQNLFALKWRAHAPLVYLLFGNRRNRLEVNATPARPVSPDGEWAETIDASALLVIMRVAGTEGKAPPAR